MEKKELREQYYKLLEKTIEITMGGFENLSDDFEKVDRLWYLGKIEDLVTSLRCMGLIENQMYANLYEEIEEIRKERDITINQVQKMDKDIEIKLLEYRIKSVKRVLDYIV